MDLNQLFLRVRNGDTNARECLFSHLRARFTLIAKRRVRQSDAEDIAHEACLTIMDKLSSLDLDVQFEAWSYQVLRNKVGNYLRRDRVKQQALPELTNAGILADATATDSDTVMSLLRCLRKIVKVNGTYARILNLIHLGYSTDEICQRLNMTRTNVYSTVSRARKMLSDCLFGEGDQDL